MITGVTFYFKTNCTNKGNWYDIHIAYNSLVPWVLL